MLPSVTVWHEMNPQGRSILTCEGRIQLKPVTELESHGVIFVQNFGFVSFRKAVREQGILPPAILFHGDSHSEPDGDACLFFADQVKPDEDKIRLSRRILMLATCPWQLLTGDLLIRRHNKKRAIAPRGPASPLELAARQLLSVHQRSGMRRHQTSKLSLAEQEILDHCGICRTLDRQLEAHDYKLPGGHKPLRLPCPSSDTLLDHIEATEVHPYLYRHLVYCDVCYTIAWIALNIIHRAKSSDVLT